MENKDKQTLDKAIKILTRLFEPGLAKVERTRIQNNKWRIEDKLTELGDVIAFIESVRNNRIEEFKSLHNKIFALEKEKEKCQ